MWGGRYEEKEEEDGLSQELTVRVSYSVSGVIHTFQLAIKVIVCYENNLYYP